MLKNKSIKIYKLLFPILIVTVLISLKNIYAEPPVATIISPGNNEVFSKTGSIAFIGDGTDLEDGELSGGRLVWVSDADGPLGKGSIVSSYLSGGTHTITLTVTDSQELSSSAQITIVVESAE